MARSLDVRTERADWRSSIVGAIGLTILAGLWLAASAGLLDYSKPALPVICGIAIAGLALLRLVAAPESRQLACITAAAGALAGIAAFAAADPPGETINMALMGLATIVFSLIGLAAGDEADRTSRP